MNNDNVLRRDFKQANDAQIKWKLDILDEIYTLRNNFIEQGMEIEEIKKKISEMYPDFTKENKKLCQLLIERGKEDKMLKIMLDGYRQIVNGEKTKNDFDLEYGMLCKKEYFDPVLKKK